MGVAAAVGRGSASDPPHAASTSPANTAQISRQRTGPVNQLAAPRDKKPLTGLTRLGGIGDTEVSDPRAGGVMARQ
jgi:hypothetical protein